MRKLISALIIMMFSISQFAYAKNNQLETNKKTVLAFYETAINKKDFNAAAKFLGPKYIQHNPLVTDGPEGLKTFIQFLKDKYPHSHSEIKQVIAEGNYVVVHVHSIREPGTRGRAIFDLFRLENGKIVEHWDTIQDVPEKSANSNGMF